MTSSRRRPFPDVGTRTPRGRDILLSTHCWCHATNLRTGRRLVVSALGLATSVARSYRESLPAKETRGAPPTSPQGHASRRRPASRGYRSARQLADPCFELYAQNTMLSPPKVMITGFMHGQPVNFGVDSGAWCTHRGDKSFWATWLEQPPALHKPDFHLCTWSGETFSEFPVDHSDDSSHGHCLRASLVGCPSRRSHPSGRNWFATLSICVTGMHNSSTALGTLRPLLDMLSLVFDAGLTGCTGLPAHMELLERATHRLIKARPVPFSPCPAVAADLDRLES